VSETTGTIDKPNRERGKRAKRRVLRVKALIFFFAESSHDDRILLLEKAARRARRNPLVTTHVFGGREPVAAIK
jgi:MFS superfamily sulfate permease-like transporter